ncbi:3-carboxyethylcatechol 2,3-dioxygenase [Pigmentiphaga sp. CHJ604]|uniref:3-carboxyethylcatechol 2,3-dioxygenase n=1 Tax=Pigmentiphaga sp. CHJ604 TaxID=3081984 RepID=UPI0030D40A85
MDVLLQCLSHTPLMQYISPGDAVRDRNTQALAQLKTQLQDFDPELIFLFGPDHYNGFFYDLMPAFCVGVAGETVGDFDTEKGRLNIPADIARACAGSLLEQGIDVAISHRMQVDHGFAQPLQLLAGAVGRHAVVPIFLNCVAEPMTTCWRARLLGEAVGRYAATLQRRCAFIGSGGLSHNPPVPQLDDAPADVAERLIAGRNPSAEARQARQQRTIAAAREFARGTTGLRPLNPAWDRQFLDTLAAWNVERLDAMQNAAITEHGGNSAHEIKTWIAANAAFRRATGGRAQVSVHYYEPIPEWISGFGTMSGRGLRG